GMALTVLNSILLGIWAFVWHRPVLTYGSLSLLAFALWQFCRAAQLPAAQTLATMALFALCLASLGHSWQLLRRQELAPPTWLALWAPAARHLSWLLGGASLVATLVLLPNAFLSPPLGRHLSQRYLILSLAECGLLWLVVATAYKRVRLAYAALLLILGAWLLAARWWLPWQDNQLFAGPAGLYLLAISWLEWTYGERRLALWLERAGLVLLLGSVFWQSFGPWGSFYALLMIVEGLLLVWAGSWRRLRRLLYIGVLTVILAVAGQLVEPLLALNSFVLLLLGAGLVGLGVALERRLEKLRGFSKEVRQLMESWE
ncbi:MAG: hypothetical protein KDE59_05940, partial [Anaerolineales bacterium]|nr:hypothetical protein [Anaerolineales bacterium]